MLESIKATCCASASSSFAVIPRLEVFCFYCTITWICGILMIFGNYIPLDRLMWQANSELHTKFCAGRVKRNIGAKIPTASDAADILIDLHGAIILLKYQIGI